jgi:uncharacterized protein (DUF4415 family)
VFQITVRSAPDHFPRFLNVESCPDTNKESDVLQTVLEMIQRKAAHLHGNVVLPGSRRPGRPRAAILRVPITVRLPEDMVSKIRASGNATRYIEDAVKMKMSKETSQK